MASIPKSILSRSKELLGTAAKVGAKELGHRLSLSGKSAVLKKQIQQAEMVVETLSKLKGAAMKTGQLLSIDATDILPPEVSEVFAKLQNKSQHFMSSDEVRKILLEQLGSDLYSQIEDLSPEPIAAASIGQVHLARWKKKAIAIKIQYPGVADSVESDIALLKKLVTTYLGIAKRHIDTKPLFEELTRVLKDEVNYEQELKNLQDFKKLIADIDYYSVPDVYPEISTQRVLSMSFETGVPLKEWISQDPPEEEKQVLGPRLLELYCREFYDWGMVQTDPNHGNFLVDPISGRITLLDFGALKRYSEEFRKNYRVFLNHVMDGRDNDALLVAYGMDLIDEREGQECKNAFLQMLRASLDSLDPEKQPFEFKDQDYLEYSKSSSIEFTRKIKYTAPPHKILFLHRKLAGVYNTLRKLGVRADLGVYWTKWIDLSKA